MTKSKQSSNKIFGIDRMMLVSIGITLIIGFFLGAQYMKSQKSSRSASNYGNDFRNFTHTTPTDLSFSSFQLKIPSDISLIVNGVEITDADYFDTSDSLFLTIKKGRSEMEIVSAAIGGGGCLYPQDPETEGPYGRYGEYKTLRSDEGDWRRSLSLTDSTKFGEEREVYTVCSGRNEDEIFSSTTSIGGISYKIYPGEEENILIFDQIVQSINVLEK